MCGTGVMIALGFFWYVVAPTIVIVLSVVGNHFISRSDFRFGRILPRVAWTLCSVLIAFLSARALEQAEIKRYNEYVSSLHTKYEARRVAELAEFWRQVSEISDELRRAETDAEISVPRLKSLQDWMFAGDMKVGPVHKDGRRELAFSDLSYEQLAAMPEDLSKVWYVGKGFERAWNNSDRFYVTVDGETRQASQGEFSVAVKRRDKLVDVFIYTNYPVKDVSYERSTLKFVKDAIGAEAYDQYLGTIKLLPRKNEPSKYEVDNNLNRAFKSKLTRVELNELMSVVKLRPCVVELPLDPKSKKANEKSPYIKLRRQDSLDGD